MDLRREIHKCFPHGDGIIVRVRWIAVDGKGKDILLPLPPGQPKEDRPRVPVHYDIERKGKIPWLAGDTHEAYVGRVVKTWRCEADVKQAIEKILLHNGLLKAVFSDVPPLEGPKRF